LIEIAGQAGQWSELAHSITRIERMLEEVGHIVDTPIEQDQTWFNKCVAEFGEIVPNNLLPTCWHLVRKAEAAFKHPDKQAANTCVILLRAELKEVAKHCNSKADQLANFYTQ
jgi:hypothetical protein